MAKKDCVFSTSHTEASPLQFDAIDVKYIVRRVALYYGVPVAFLALESPEGIHFKARHGMECKYLPHSKSGASICRHMVKRNLPIIIENAGQDSRFLNDPLVAGPVQRARFYVGAPLMYSQVCCVGTLCIMDDKPRDFFGLGESKMLVESAKKVMDLYKLCELHIEFWKMAVTSDCLPAIDIQDSSPGNGDGSPGNEEDDDRQRFSPSMLYS